jgi:hypothetical protein
MFGRDRFDRWGMFIPWADRGPMTSSIDAGNSSGGSGGGTTIGSFEALQHFGILLASNPNNRNIQFRGNSDGTFTVTWTETIIRGTGQFYTNELGTTHEEMEFQYIDHTTAASGNGGGGSIGGATAWMKTVNNVANGLGIYAGIKQELWLSSVYLNYKTGTNPIAFHNLRPTQQSWRINNTLTKTGSKLLKATTALGAATGVVQVGVKLMEINQKGYATNRDKLDIAVNTAGVVAAVFLAGTPVGWAIGAGVLLYSVGTTIYDNYNP